MPASQNTITTALPEEEKKCLQQQQLQRLYLPLLMTQTVRHP